MWYLYERRLDGSIYRSGPFPVEWANEMCVMLHRHGIGAYMSPNPDVGQSTMDEHPDWWGVPMDRYNEHDAWLEERFGIIVDRSQHKVAEGGEQGECLPLPPDGGPADQREVDDELFYLGPLEQAETEEQLSRQYDVPVSDPDVGTDDPGDRESWSI